MLIARLILARAKARFLADLPEYAPPELRAIPCNISGQNPQFAWVWLNL